MRQARHSRFSAVRPGLTAEEVRTLLGPPDLVCRGAGSLGLHQDQVRDGRGEEVVARLAPRTATRWIYSYRRDRPPKDCLPQYNDAEIGFSIDGKVIWLIEQTHESQLTYSQT